MEIAAEEKLTVSLVTEMMDVVEVDGAVCRDAAITSTGSGSGTISELRWWINFFVDYIWDGPKKGAVMMKTCCGGTKNTLWRWKRAVVQKTAIKFQKRTVSKEK